MDINKFEEFKTKIERKLINMEANVSYIHEGVKGLSESVTDLKEEMTDFMSFAIDSFSDHENKLTYLEKKFNN